MQTGKNRTLLPHFSRCHLLQNQCLIKWNSWFACYLPILRVIASLGAASQVCADWKPMCEVVWPSSILITQVRSLHVHQHKLDALDIDGIVSFCRQMWHAKSYIRTSYRTVKLNRCFRLIYIGSGVANHSDLEVQWMTSLRFMKNHVQYSHLSLPLKKHRFCAKLVAHPAGNWGWNCTPCTPVATLLIDIG
jgi:hypothetical protein